MKKKDARPRVVFDCMLYLQATANDEGPAAVAFRLLDEGAFSLFVTREILAEVQDVLSRPKIRAQNPRITYDSLRAFSLSFILLSLRANDDEIWVFLQMLSEHP